MSWFAVSPDRPKEAAPLIPNQQLFDLLASSYKWREAAGDKSSSRGVYLAVNQKGHPKKPIGKRKYRPKPAVPKAFLFGPQPFNFESPNLADTQTAWSSWYLSEVAFGNPDLDSNSKATRHHILQGGCAKPAKLYYDD